MLDPICSVWAPYKKGEIEALEKVKKRATKILPALRHLTYPDRLKACKLTTLHYRQTRMWANAHRDARPAEYRWHPLFNAAKFGWRPLLEYRAVTLPRRETRWNLQGCPKLPDRSQPLVGLSSLYCADMWGRYCCLTRFFRLSIRALLAKI